jgi:dTDP-4-amino-4,6-dideoxygalactose transaminase
MGQSSSRISRGGRSVNSLNQAGRAFASLNRVRDQTGAQERPILLVAEPVLGAEEKAALCEVIDSGWITMGARVRAFERAFGDLHGVSDCVAVNSCTAGLHLALKALDVRRGDEVLLPSLTFVATANSVLYIGAKPVFVDIESVERPLMSVSDAESKCTSRTRAIILMHYAGYLNDKSAWIDFAERKGLLLIEDAAHAVGIDEVGKYGDAAAFSFYGNKNMTTAEGGVVFAKDRIVLDRVRQMRGHGMTSDTVHRLINRSSHYDVTMLGFNYRMDDLRAAIGLTQLKNLLNWNRRRRTLTRIYREELARMCPAVCAPFAADDASANHIMPVILPSHVDRDEVAALLRDAGIQTTVHYPPVHQLKYYRAWHRGQNLQKTEHFARHELTLPLHPRMQDSEVEYVAVTLAGALGQAHA